MHYLSAVPEALTEVLITGIPPLARPTDDIYRATYLRVIAKTAATTNAIPRRCSRARLSST